MEDDGWCLRDEWVLRLGTLSASEPAPSATARELVEQWLRDPRELRLSVRSCPDASERCLCSDTMRR